VGAYSCPECGSDEKTGWSTEAEEWNPDIPTGYSGDDDFDYEAFMDEEFGEAQTRRSKRKRKQDMLGLCVTLLIIFFIIQLVLNFKG